MVQRILGTLIMWYGATLVPPMFVSMLYRDGQLPVFFIGAALIAVIGFVLWFPARHATGELSLRQGFMVVAAYWLALGPIAAMPFLLAETPVMSFTHAVFEAVSGLSTTGATVLTGIDALPLSILYYRQQICWVGGLGIVVLAVAVLPMLGLGGMQLYKAEAPGASKDKLTPRIKETAQALWIVYVGLTALCALSFWLAGMSLFDAVGHSYAAIATAGFSTHDASLGYWDSPLIEYIGAAFMWLAGVNFALHFLVWRGLSLRHYFNDPEFKFYMWVSAALIALITFYLWGTGTYPSLLDALRYGSVNYVSMATTTGFTTAAFDTWPGFVPMLLILIGFMGACAGSTSGGLKAVRLLVMLRQTQTELRRLLHPRAEVPITLGGRTVPDRVVQAIFGYFGVYIVVFVVLFLALLATGLDYVSAFTGLATCMNGVGPGLGKVFAHMQAVSDAGQWIIIAAMILGRLEIYTFIVLLTPEFWRD